MIVCVNTLVFFIFPRLAHGYIGGSRLFRLHAVIWFVGLMLMITLPISKFHLLWIYPLGWIVPYIIFQIRMNLATTRLNATNVKRHLEKESEGEVWSYSEMRRMFRVYEVESPRKYAKILQSPELEAWWVAKESGIGSVKVVRRGDNIKGSLLFKDDPRFYFDWHPDL